MVFWILLGVVAAVVLLTVLVNGILALLQLRYVAGIAPVQYKNQLQPQPLDGRWVFTSPAHLTTKPPLVCLAG